MKRNQADAIARLKTLYAKKGENQIFARMWVKMPDDLRECLKAMAGRIPPGDLPTGEQVFPVWDKYLRHYDAIEDDWVPAIYPWQYDQGIYGTLFGAELHVNPSGPPGCASSMSLPLEGASYDELIRLAEHPRDQWVRRMEKDLRYLSAQSRGQWGVAVPITIDGLNLAQQIRGNQFLLDLYDCPEDLKRFLQAGVRLNSELVERARAAIGPRREEGVCDFFNGGWMPGQSVPMSVDCYNLCRAEVYAEFGRPYQQQLIDHFGGGNFHLHGNGRHLLGEMARLKGCVAASISNDGSEVRAVDDLENIKDRAGSITPFVSCDADEFVRRLREQSLVGGVYYTVSPVPTVEDANRLMESVRSYRV
jgi:hypothetical protein